MIEQIDFHIEALESMKKYPKELFYTGDVTLLQRRKVSIVGSRKPNQYARDMTYRLVQKLTQADICIVSGGAIGIDAIAHKSAGSRNTIMVAATGLDKRYPSINKNLIKDIEENGLVLSQFKPSSLSTKYNFVLRNELVVALGEVLIVSYAELDSGTMRSVAYAQQMGKQIYVLPHRIGDSEGTNRLLADKKAEAIYDIDDFVDGFTHCYQKNSLEVTPFLAFCAANPSYEEALKIFPSEIFEAELQGLIEIKNAKVYLL